MGKKDHPAYGGGTKYNQPKYMPHILPSIMFPGIYYLHQHVRGEHSVTRIVGLGEAEEKLSTALARARST